MIDLGECPNNTQHTVCLSPSCPYKHDRVWPIPPAIQEAMNRELDVENAYGGLIDRVREAREDEQAFQADLAKVINQHSRENRSNTSDFMLAEYLVSCLEAFEALADAKRRWSGLPPEMCDGVV